MNTIDKTSKSSALTIAILTGVTNLMALATSANATIVGINGIGDISNVKLPTTFASNLSSDIGGATVSNGATPDIALTWALSGNGWERHSSDVWNALDPATGTPDIAQIDYDNSNGTDEPTITFAAGAGVALQLNSLDIGHASDQSEAAFAWTITITEDGGPQVFSHTTAAMGPGDTEAVVFNFTGRPGVDYILEFDGADRTNRGALDNLSFNQVVPAADVPAAILAAVPGSLQYSLIYEASIPELTPAWGAGATYTIDNSATGPASFDRVAYIMELDDTWVWVSYDTPLQANTLATVGVPTVATVDGTPIQTTVVNMDVFSSITDANVITTGTGLSSGNIEFWPGNYNQGNDANIPNADPETLDFGDGGAATDVGYGSMQVHNHAASQTIFAFNRWGGAFTGTTDIGIGTNGTGVGEPDYTFSENARNYTTRNLYVLVREGAPTFPPPEATMALSSVAGDKIMLTFSEEVSSDSVDVANFSIAGGPALTAATSSGNIVTLTTSGLVGGTTYTVNYTGVSGLPGRGPALIATVTIDFSAPILPAILASIPAAAGYDLIYHAEIPEAAPRWGNGAPYLVDQSSITDVTAFDRVAYVMELDGDWVFVSFETLSQGSTFATIGIPTVDVVAGTPIQTILSNMDVSSSIAGITEGTGLSGGNIEFWPGNFIPNNVDSIPNADDTTFDWGDGGGSGDLGYGTMQIHNHDASEVLFAFNRWGGGGGTTDIGIGNNPNGAGNPDYVFAENAASFESRNIYVLVREGIPMLPAPEVTRSSSSLAGNQIQLTFSEEISRDSVDLANFSIVGGPAITDIVTSGNVVILTTSGLVAGTTYTVNYTGVAGLPGAGIALAETLTQEFTAPAIPTLLGTIPAAEGYELIYHAEIPEAAPAWGNGAPYLVDQSGFTESTNFDRVAYIMELDGEWVFVSYDTLEQANRLSTIGIPTVDVVAGTPIQTILSNMDVSSSIAGITEGTGLSGGNIEFWPGNFIPNNVDSIPNADDTTFDWGDGGGSGDLGYGTMQIHNHDASEVLFAFNRWGGGGGTTDIGIGNNPDGAGNPDYVFAENAASFASRNIYVLVRPTLLTLPAAIASSVPEARGYNLVYQMDLPGVNEFSGDAQNIAEAYAADYSATVEPGSRVAYVLQLDDEWVWVSFDAPTDDLTKIGIPHLGVAPTAIQQIVTDMNVASNAPQITRGTFAEGNIEFWSGNYGPENALGIANADEGTFDFGDTMAGGGHGSMQIHNFMESETVFSYNNWGSNNPGQAGGLGIGTNNTGEGEPDWTFAGTSDAYTSRTLYVLTGEPMPFQITSIEVNSGNNEVTVIWPSVEGEIFSISWSDDLEIFTEIDDSVPGGAGSTSFIDIVPAGTPKRFYRVTKEN
ncbi:MAG: Ig-like domain-containing protein [Akkermansiaceae bacterium]|nr:Ig-like domain-containing protein [Akkermansiaceae bacterium]